MGYPLYFLFRSTMNLSEFVATPISPRICIIKGNMSALFCTLSIRDSTTTAGWMWRLIFHDDDDDEK